MIIIVKLGDDLIVNLNEVEAIYVQQKGELAKIAVQYKSGVTIYGQTLCSQAEAELILKKHYDVIHTRVK